MCILRFKRSTLTGEAYTYESTELGHRLQVMVFNPRVRPYGGNSHNLGPRSLQE